LSDRVFIGKPLSPFSNPCRPGGVRHAEA
jgi:hypothetical protein